MKCPGCHVELKKERIKRIDIDRCPSCSGIWLDKGELDALTDKKNRLVEFNSVEYDSGLHGDAFPERECPRCGDMMKKVDLFQDSPVIYDFCPVCKGFWLDKNELNLTKKYMKKYEEEDDVLDNIILTYMSQIGDGVGPF